ncbi:hypothetical protein FRC17_004280 [Serendipita sp. 399]|nr:hypothetical protein FRC17_004280 [Serendipita sp. 399]
MATTHQFDDKKANFKVLLSTAFGAVKREVDCRVVLTIHTVTNLPVLDGSYRVRWKFRDIDSKVARQFIKDQARSLAGGDPTNTHHADHSASSKSSNNNNNTPGDSSSTDINSSSASSGPVGRKSNAANISPEERGATPYRNLQVRDHSVIFEHTVEVVAHMRVVRGELIGEPLKLVVERLTDENEDSGNMKFEPRVGHKFIDLAEFVNEGKIRRKYLLERSKTNAMVTISLEITTLKPGMDFKKPDLRQDHLLIGRKETMTPPKRDRPLTPLNTSPTALRDPTRPSLNRASSVTSTTSSSSRGHSSRGYAGLPPTRSETEAVIEALFNPTIFTSKPITPSKLSTMEVPQAAKVDDPLTPRPKDAGSERNRRDSRNSFDSSDDEDEYDDLRSQSENSKDQSGVSGRRSHSGERSRQGSLPNPPKTALDVALDMNHAFDHEKTVRPKFPSPSGQSRGHGQEESWEFINFKDGGQGVIRKSHPERSGTGDSTATDFSTTSSKSYVSSASSTRASPEGVSSSFTSFNVTAQPRLASHPPPVISVIAETPTTATQEGFNIARGRWYKPKPSKKASGGGPNSNQSSRSSTPAPGEKDRATSSGRGGGRPSMDSHIGEQLRMLVVGDRPLVSTPGKIDDGREGSRKSGQTTPTPSKSDQTIVSVQ